VTRDHAVRLLAIRTDDGGAQDGSAQNGGTQNGGTQNGGTQNGGTQNGGQVLWRPSDRRPLRRTDRLVVVATRAGLSHLLADTTTPSEVNHSIPYRLLEPWLMPHSRATSPEGPEGHPPFGPADADSTRPA
jgi:hypothetical protein